MISFDKILTKHYAVQRLQVLKDIKMILRAGCEQIEDSKLDLGTAMDLYGLTNSELFWEKSLDTKLLVAWNKNTVVFAFRGTASLSNVLADIQARSVYSL